MPSRPRSMPTWRVTPRPLRMSPSSSNWLAATSQSTSIGRSSEPDLGQRTGASSAGARQLVDVGGVLHQHHLEATRSARGGPESIELFGLVDRGTAGSESELAAPAKVGPKLVEAGLQHWHARSTDRCGAVNARRQGGDEQRGGAVLGDVVGDGGHHLVEGQVDGENDTPLLPTRLGDICSPPPVPGRG